MTKFYAARMLERKASISERRTSVSRRCALDAFSTSPAAVPASAEAMRTNLVGGFRGLAGQVLHLGGHHRKSPPGFAGARGFDGGVKREQVGVRRDGLRPRR